jgi:hypothetical protein
MSSIINTDLEEVLLSKREVIESMVSSLPRASLPQVKPADLVAPEKLEAEAESGEQSGEDDLACDDEVGEI